MLKREKLHLLPALMVAVENDHSPVTYLVLSLRLCGLGGDRACRGILAEMQQLGWVHVQRHTGLGDGREKVVYVTEAGFAALDHHHSLMGKIVDLARQSAGSVRRRISMLEDHGGSLGETA